MKSSFSCEPLGGAHLLAVRARRLRRRQCGRSRCAVEGGALASGDAGQAVQATAARGSRSAGGRLRSTSLLAHGLLLLRIAGDGRLDETDELGRFLDLLGVLAEVLREDVAGELDVRVRGTDILQHHVRLTEDVLGLSDRHRVGAVDEFGELAVLEVQRERGGDTVARLHHGGRIALFIRARL